MADSSHNNTIEHHRAVEEINEVALKDFNLTGTLVAKKIDPLPLIAGTRRAGFVDNSSKALQIDFNHPKAYNQINDNKIETVEQETKFDSSHENLKTVLGNYTQMSKNSNLSKIVVNELKKGSEIIGDANAPVTSNITFTPENDTLTAMAFIAGNLLNKLWDMEKDASTTSTETDVMKHEKIADLLDLFKEPLNIRQETFLKNALEQLSTAVDKNKNAQNISICQTITDVVHNNDTSEEDKTQVTTKAPCDKDKDKPVEEPKIKHKKAAIKAIAKINNVLDLIKKFEKVQSNLSELKHGPKLNFDYNRTLPKTRKKEVDNLLSKEEESSLNVFGGILEKITKLILPKKNNKKIVNLIRSQSVLLNNENILKKKFQKMYNIDLTNMTVTAKDKIILDYLTQVDRNKDCLLKTNSNEITESIPTIEGNILLNLSEFFKMKSFSDLIQLLEPERSKNHRSIESEKETVETTTKYKKGKAASINKPVDTNKLNSTKEKLKAHLKTIIEDLMELQTAKGGSLKGNVKLADALPCIYNVLNAGKNEIDTKKDVQPAKSIATIFEDVKKEYKLAQTRRNFVDVTKERPKSAVIWDRLVKTLNNKANSKNRRKMNAKVPKTYHQIKKMMEKIENGSATYKHYALVVKTPPTGKLILLKTLDQEVQATINVINEITLSLKELAKLPAEKFAELDEFVTNLVTSTKLTEKVDEKLKADAKKSKINTENEISKSKPKETQYIRNDVPQRAENDEMRISRVQIVSQLIKNRLQVFLKTKEQLNNDVRSDMSYNVARKIIHYLDTGNFDLANELFKVLVSQKPNDFGVFPNGDSANDKLIVTTTPKLGEMSLRRMSILGREALLPVEEPSRRTEKHINWVNQDHLIKQLLNMKNMGL
nr:uncharacterized protein LOC110376682 [Helicoverpa armigera]